MFKNLLNQASTSRSSNKAPKDKFSLENLKYLYSQLVKYPVVDSSNANRIVEVLRAIAELMIWGDQHNPLFFDYFAEKNILTNFARIIAQRSAETKVKTQVIQTLSILIQNTDSEQAVFYLLSNNYINDLIVSRFDFSDEELLAHYISFLKTLSFKLNTRTILFFYNDKANDFPLYVEALKFFNHQETMVRTAVRTLTLNTFKVDDERMRRFILERTCLPYFCNLVWFLKDQTLSMSRMIEQTGNASVGKVEEHVETMIDFMFYLQDILSLNIDRMSGILTDQLLSHFIMPVLIGSLVARYDPQKIEKAKTEGKPPASTATPSASASAPSSSTASTSSAPPSAPLGKQVGLVSAPPQRESTIQARLALYMLGQVFLCFSHYGLINSIVIALLHPTPPVICETIVRTPIKYPFRHPRLPLTGIIFPKSLHVAPVVEVVPEAAPSPSSRKGKDKAKATAENGVPMDVRDSEEKEPSTKAPDLLFSPRDEDEAKDKDDSTNVTTSGGSKLDSTHESALDFFSSQQQQQQGAGGMGSRSSSPAPSVGSRPSSAAPSPVPQLVDGEHAGLLDMFSGIAPTPSSPTAASAKPPLPGNKPTGTPPTTPPNASSSSAAAASSSSSSSTVSTPAPSTASATSRPSTGSPASPGTPTSTLSLAASSSANSLNSLRKTITKSASAASEKLTNIITSSKPLGVGVLDAPLGVFVLGDVVYVLDTGHHRVQLFDAKTLKQGKRIGSKGNGDGQLMECEGVCVHPSTGHIYVSDHNNHRVTVFDGKGGFVRTFGVEGLGVGQFKHPTGLAISNGTGLLYVCDSWNHRVCIYDGEGRHVRSIGGKKGDGDGELSEPAHVAVCQSPLDHTQDRVYVTDYGNDRVQVFDQDGKFLLKFGKTGRERGEFIAPIGLTINTEALYIVDRGNHRVQVFDLQGGFVRSVGKKGDGGGELNEPNGVAVGHDGRIYIADSGNNRVMIMVPERSLTQHTPFTYQQNAYTQQQQKAPDSTTQPTAPQPSAAPSDASSAALSGVVSPPSSSALSPPPSGLTTSHSTDEFKHEVAPDLNLKARSSLPEMKIVYNPEKVSDRLTPHTTAPSSLLLPPARR